MRLHENTSLFADAVRFTAQNMNLPPEYVEKDYWITYALHTIFQSSIGKDVIFKGGTALAKCYMLIERFSEDIDLVVVRYDDESDTRLKSKLKDISNIVGVLLPEVGVYPINRPLPALYQWKDRKKRTYIQRESELSVSNVKNSSKS